VELFPEVSSADAPAAPAPEDEASSDPEGSVLGVPFWVATGVTGAAGVVTLVFGMRTLNDKEELDGLAPGDGNLDEVKQRGERDRLVTNIMIGVTGAAAVTALIIGLTDLASSKERNTSAVSLVPGPGAGFGLEATF